MIHWRLVSTSLVALNDHQVNGLWSMEELTNFIHCKRQVRASDYAVLQSPNNAHILVGLDNKSPSCKDRASSDAIGVGRCLDSNI